MLDHCSLPRAQGNCTGRESKWYYDTPEKRCLPFYYSGCNGNDNNFDSREACESDCPRDIGELVPSTEWCGNTTAVSGSRILFCTKSLFTLCCPSGADLRVCKKFKAIEPLLPKI